LSASMALLGKPWESWEVWGNLGKSWVVLSQSCQGRITNDQRQRCPALFNQVNHTSMTSSESANNHPLHPMTSKHTFVRSTHQNVMKSHVRLSGGLVNVTVRTKRLQPSRGQNDQGIRKDISSTRFQGHASIIIEYAPPFIAAIGEFAPFSPCRRI
jgi:hypothetical protein